MGTVVLYLGVVALVAAVVFVLASVLFGRGEELAPLPPGATPTRLPADRVTGDDVRALRFPQAVRGYRVAEVDWVLDRTAAELDALRARVRELEGGRAGPAAGPELDARTDRVPGGTG